MIGVSGDTATVGHVSLEGLLLPLWAPGGDAVQHEVTNEDLAGGIEVTVGDVVAPGLLALEHLAAAQLVIDLTARAARLRCVRFIADDHSAVRFPLSTMQEKLTELVVAPSQHGADRLPRDLSSDPFAVLPPAHHP